MYVKDMVSVIVPIYNTGKYLFQCLNSIKNQSYQNMQVICINDGSTDNSEEIIRSFLIQDRRFEVITHENKGYGASMNCGLSCVKGEYTAFVESDDFISDKAIECLTRYAMEYPEVDFVKLPYFEYFEYTNKKTVIRPSELSGLIIPDPFLIEEHPEIISSHPSIWSALYRSEFLHRSTIRFQEAPGAGWTDNPFFMETLIRARHILWRPDKHYYYRQTNPDSSSNLKDCTIPFLRLLEIFDFMDNYGVVNQQIMKRHYQRCFFYMKIISDNPYYEKEKVYPLMVATAARMLDELVADKFFSDEDRAIYNQLRKDM